jgi:predicted glycosyltransferase
MRILIDIGHPAHVHYFKNFIRIMKEKGHEFLVISRDKEITFQLLDAYDIPYESRGKGNNSLFGKLLYLVKGDAILIRKALRFKPDIFLSFGSSYAAQASFILRKPHIAFDDTEHAKLEHALYIPFTDAVLTPVDFKKNFGKKQIRFNSTMDLAYLHPDYFSPNKEVLKTIKKESNEKLFLVRFVSWAASHDNGFSGFSLEGKRKLVSILSRKGKVLISSESKLPEEFKKYEIQIEPDKIHDLMYSCDLFVGESGSMATEAAILGTPSIIVNSSAKLFGVFNRIAKYKSLFIYDDEKQALNKTEELCVLNFKIEAKKIAQRIIEDSIDTTSFMVWFIENYPKSVNILKENPNYQYKFH